ncbi:MAG: alpha/beta hydrolase [Saprospiraceae bacterium]|nr:alpha/beta hydrolase [Saprospiraceae bacterium]
MKKITISPCPLPATYCSFLFILGLFFTLAACGGGDMNKNKPVAETPVNVPKDTMPPKPGELKPSGPKPTWGPTITDPMQTVIEKLMSFNAPPIPKSTAEEARQNPTPTDAVMALIKEKNIMVPPSMVDTMGKTIPVKGGSIHARIYTPKTGSAPFPVIVYYHGGGWVIADLDVYDASAKGLAEQVGAIVVSVAYRLAPEFKFPTAHNDSYAAYEWAVKNAVSINGDPKRIAVVGESAGGNLAAGVSMMARDKKMMVPLHEVLVYPITQTDMTTESYTKYADAKPLDKPMMSWFFDKYLPNKAAMKNPMISLVNANLKGMPPTTIIVAELDPLQSDGQMLADKLKAAGVATMIRKYAGVTHEFFGMAAVLPEAKAAQALAADELKKAFNK